MISFETYNNFNSIKVRLKPHKSISFHASGIDFNSIKVRLKRLRRALMRSKNCYFNSIKVRLKLWAT